MASNDSRSLFVLTFRQLINTRHVRHWALFLARPGEEDTGNMYHVVYSVNKSVSQSIQATAPLCGTKYDVGFATVEEYNPVNSRALTSKTFVASEIYETDILEIGAQIEKKYPYTIADNNCQNFVIRVLNELLARGKVTQEQYNEARKGAGDTVFTAWDKVCTS
ncbi:hypothetical protein LOY97_005176 [Ophidiomyces ophidiicola]|nr:hypothetical protein LOZ49_000190 [Ophidiomyces ophidiicola]KAI2142076.1 hypothetical protein LOZ29_001566 [Ophidiomyces ophidiicola]KAI2144600.1 hypothetical protein LOZ28_001423 [Ophidiomyces ophidiicola]KAI2221094.1 hypothetical protein LOZ15_001954 [Ophidiomyces ophidiicola]KAI2441888.1 hypothetical protein LOZ08_003330 [Ophidiomyces ophidiicola]